MAVSESQTYTFRLRFSSFSKSWSIRSTPTGRFLRELVSNASDALNRFQFEHRPTRT